MNKYYYLLCLIFITYGHKHILVIDASDAEKREFSRPDIQKNYRFSYFNLEDTHTNLTHKLKKIKRRYRRKKLDGVISSEDYIGNLMAALIADTYNLPGPGIKNAITCQHKYYSRIKQQQYVPKATPRFDIIDPANIYINANKLSITPPFFVKPIKAYFSFGAEHIHTFPELKSKLLHITPTETFAHPLNTLLRDYGYTIPAHYLLAEECLQGDQVTVEGYIQNGKAYIIGIVDSIMYPNTFSFEHFEYPSRLPYNIQKRMEMIARTCMEKMAYGTAFFNIEMMYNTKNDTIHIIEINPRHAAQFTDLYEKVDGTNSYTTLLALATNSPLPTYKKNNGPYAVAASFALRVFFDGRVTQSPSSTDIAAVYSLFPDARIQIHAEQNKLLSDMLQDGKSYLYAIINIGGCSKKDLFDKFAQCKRMLPFQITPT